VDRQASRRALLTGTGIAVVAAAAGATWYATAGPSPRASAPGSYPQPKSTSGAPTPLAQVAQIPEGGGVVLDAQSVVLTRDTGDKVHAFSAICTHQGCLVSAVSNGKITCPCHGSTFDANTGAVLGGPAPTPLPAVPVTVTNGTVYSG
jgi:Rieske Fe-S protein